MTEPDIMETGRDSGIITESQTRDHGGEMGDTDFSHLTEEERLKIQDKADRKRQRDRVRWRDMTTDLGRVTFRVEGVDILIRVHLCKICGSLVLRDTGEQHIRWHEKESRG